MRAARERGARPAILGEPRTLDPIGDGHHGPPGQPASFGLVKIGAGPACIALAGLLLWRPTIESVCGAIGALLFGISLIASGNALARAGVIVDERGIALRGAHRDRILPWSEISHFDIGRLGLREDAPAAVDVVLTDGTPVTVKGQRSKVFFTNAARQRALVALQAAALNRRLLAVRAGASASPGSAVV